MSGSWLCFLTLVKWPLYKTSVHPSSTLPSGHRADCSRRGAFCCGRLTAVGGLVSAVGPHSGCRPRPCLKQGMIFRESGDFWGGQHPWSCLLGYLRYVEMIKSYNECRQLAQLLAYTLGSMNGICYYSFIALFNKHFFRVWFLRSCARCLGQSCKVLWRFLSGLKEIIHAKYLVQFLTHNNVSVNVYKYWV